MRTAELVNLAGVTCAECAFPFLRVEARWHLDEDGGWRSVYTHVCASGHRCIVEPLEPWEPTRRE